MVFLVTPYSVLSATLVAPALLLAAFLLSASAMFRGQALGGALVLVLTLTAGLAACAGGCLYSVS